MFASRQQQLALLHSFDKKQARKRLAADKRVLSQQVLIKETHTLGQNLTNFPKNVEKLQDFGITRIPKQVEDRPGILDNNYFKEGEDVKFWRHHYFTESKNGPNLQSVEGLNKFGQVLLEAFISARIFRDETSVRYWAYHIFRTAFFITLGFTGALTSQVLNQNQSPILFEEETLNGKQGLDVAKLLKLLFFGPPAEAMVAYKQDLKNIQQGLYKLPWDMTTPQHHQYDPEFVVKNSIDLVKESVKILTRSGNANQQPLWLDSNLYPDYYKNTFHYQTDGWMSSKSAQIYEASTETVFFGRQDVMLRHTLIPIRNWLKNNKKQLKNMHALEVAAGTGRFATFFKDNYPDIHLTVSELSPFYLEQARKNMDEWYNLRMNKNSNQQSQCMNVDFVQAAAENLPFDDSSFDIVYCTYLFHETPYDVRVKAIDEFSRVLRPGGILVVTDSYQLGDRLALDKSIENFQKFNEPFYSSYIRTNFGEIFENANLKCDQKIVCSVTKVLSATKPEK
eukprot:TRINITY_DN306_c1_g1_i4.p1 TRINITY_DN306_c1_g1~~TRINITY_DN306_c1_g1_i4.p1  ORF type:complete len:508 (+),score=73.91 TRINITY_DN306_c1_g1_i4:96-1619(+)